MSLSRRLRNIAKSQVNALKERLDRIDEEAEVDDLSQRAERDAAKELDDPTDIRPARRSPEEIAAGTRVKAPTAAPPLRSAPAQPPTYEPASSPLSLHYRRLGVAEGADLSTVEDAYKKLKDTLLRQNYFVYLGDGSMVVRFVKNAIITHICIAKV